MFPLATPYVHLRDALTAGDIEFLGSACKRHLRESGMPCYTLLNQLDRMPCIKIKTLLEQVVGTQLYYLNDFYIYTDSSFKTSWHMDTELFTFEVALNAWVLLSPDSVEDPLGLMDEINESPQCTFHSMTQRGDQCIFGNYRTGEATARSLAAIEAGQIRTPRIQRGDILVFNPRQFHRTNTSDAKHALALKFLMRGSHGFLSPEQVDPMFWPEVEVFNKLMSGTTDWNSFIEGVKRALRTADGLKALSAGFYPEKFALYQQMSEQL